MKILGLVLAGGKSRRMGGETKALKSFNGEPIYRRILSRLAPQVDHVVLNSNDPPDILKGFDLPVINDVVPGRIGPLSGVLSGLYYCEYLGCQACLVVPCDGAFLSETLADSLRQAFDGSCPVYASVEGKPQPVFSLWPLACMEALEALVVEEGKRAVIDVLEALGAVPVDFPATDARAFSNLNTPEEWAEAESLARQ